jgi:hypothetical protein
MKRMQISLPAAARLSVGNCVPAYCAVGADCSQRFSSVQQQSTLNSGLGALLQPLHAADWIMGIRAATEEQSHYKQ